MKRKHPHAPVGDVMYGIPLSICDERLGGRIYCRREMGPNGAGNLDPRHLTANDKNLASFAGSRVEEASQVSVSAAVNDGNTLLV
jgi:hypothetical protein